ALPQLLPAGSVLYLEGSSVSKDVRDFLRPRQVAHPQKLARGTIWPRPECFHIPATPENIEGLAALFVTHAWPEICNHFHVYGPAGVILEWYDSFFTDPLYVSKAVPEDTVKSFCDLIGSQYSDATKGA